MTNSARMAALMAAASALVLAGCGGGGGGGGPAATTTTATTTSTTGTTGTGTTGTTGSAGTSGSGNSFYVTLPITGLTGTPGNTNPAFGPPGNQSAATGSTTTVIKPTAWTQVTTIDPNNQDMVDYAKAHPGDLLYSRTSSVAMTNGPVGATSSSATLTQWAPASSFFTSQVNGVNSGACTPNSTGCKSAFNGNFGGFQGGAEAATQNGAPVTQTTVNINQPVNIRHQEGSANNLGGYLQDSYIGQYSDQSLTAKLITTANGPDLDPNNTTGSVTTGFYFAGNATPTADMTTLKSGNVKATYTGAFQGTQLVGSTASDIFSGNFPGVTLNADFGKGTVAGNVYNLQTATNCTSTSCTQTPLSYGLAVNGTISGNSYSGTTSFTGVATAPGAAATGGTGNLLGGFFGAGAAETAGVVRVTGTAPGVTGTTSVIGAYGAKK